jgi:hypothetical protein
MRFILAILLCFIFTSAQAATIDLGYTSKVAVDTDRTTTKMYYTGASVAASTDQVFKITVDSAIGYVRNIAFEDATSLDCDVWLSEVEDAAKTAVETIIALDEIVAGYSPEISANVYFYNGDSPIDNVLYFTVSNQDAVNATGAWELTLTVGKK